MMLEGAFLNGHAHCFCFYSFDNQCIDKIGDACGFAFPAAMFVSPVTINWLHGCFKAMILVCLRPDL